MIRNWAKKFKKNKIGMIALIFVLLFALVGLYAPFLASSKPFIVIWQGKVYFPFFRYLFFSGFYTKPIDLFYNLLMFTLPLGLVSIFLSRSIAKGWIAFTALLQIGLFIFILSGVVKDPAADFFLSQKRQEALSLQNLKKEKGVLSSFILAPSWNFELSYMNDYRKLNILIKQQLYERQHKRIQKYAKEYESIKQTPFPTEWNHEREYEQREIERIKKELAERQEEYEEAKKVYNELIVLYQPLSHTLTLAQNALTESSPLKNESSFVYTSLETAYAKISYYLNLKAKLHFLHDKKVWIENQKNQMHLLVFPLLRLYHWEDNAGGSSSANQYLPWYEVSRTNRKDLAAALLFGIRISFVVGMTAVALALVIGGLLGMIAGYFSGKTDLVVCRWIEIWEAMPTFFMLLLVVAITQSKSIFLVISVLGLFGWTGFARFMRAEVLKQRNLNYTLAARALGFGPLTIMGKEILPNAIAPILTLLPFSMMAAMTSEAGLSFLGLGEEGSSSLGVLMDEGRHAFPGESYLLWPAAIVLTILLVSIAIVGDALRDAIDPRSSQ